MSDDLARDVLVHWALPLLTRARRCADDPARTSQWAWEALADDIAALIGHPVTDQPPAPELDEVLADADLPPVREKLVDSARLGTAEHFQAARNVARSAAPKKEQAPAAPRIAGVLVGPGVDPAEARALMDRVNAARGHAPDAQAVHAPTTPEGKSRESATRTPLPEAFAPRPPRCPTCGARP